MAQRVKREKTLEHGVRGTADAGRKLLLGDVGKSSTYSYPATPSERGTWGDFQRCGQAER